jgi:zinc-ribbon domain
MEPVKIPIVCPIFKTEQDINIGRLKELVASLPAQSSKEFLLPSGVSINKALALCREVIQMHDVRHVRTFKTTDDKTYETWYYGKTKVEMIDLVIKASVSKETERIEIFVAAPDQEDIMGLLAELGRNISKRGEALGKPTVFNVSIKDSPIIRSSLLDACNINGICDGNVVIENSSVRRSSIANNANNVNIHIKDSNVERSTIGAGTKKCPNCGIEVEGEQKFCLECGAKL